MDGENYFLNDDQVVIENESIYCRLHGALEGVLHRYERSCNLTGSDRGEEIFNRHVGHRLDFSETEDRFVGEGALGAQVTNARIVHDGMLLAA